VELHPSVHAERLPSQPLNCTQALQASTFTTFVSLQIPVVVSGVCATAGWKMPRATATTHAAITREVPEIILRLLIVGIPPASVITTEEDTPPLGDAVT
jgi:ABC-type arginine transport system permease subunit